MAIEGTLARNLGGSTRHACRFYGTENRWLGWRPRGALYGDCQPQTYSQIRGRCGVAQRGLGNHRHPMRRGVGGISVGQIASEKNKALTALATHVARGAILQSDPRQVE